MSAPLDRRAPDDHAAPALPGSIDPFAGGGEMAAIMRSIDWTKTALGPVTSWPQSLRTALSILLETGFPMCIAWGAKFTQFYNDGYRPILGAKKHPAAMGISTRETFAEIWDIIGPMFEGVMRGTATTVVDVLLPIDRHGFVEECYFSFSCSPIRAENGEVGGVLVTVMETKAARIDGLTAGADDHIEQRRQLLFREQQARADAEIANRSKDQFLAMLGHELRNPLAPILTALELMRDSGSPSTELTLVIERQVTHLVRLIDDLLDVSRVARGRVELKRSVAEIAEIVTRAVEMASPLLERREQRLTVLVARHGLQIDGDEARLAQILSNLVTNAAKYTEPGGSITIAASREGGDVVIKVTDTGIGIAPEMLPTIFDMFVQEQQSIDRSQGGLGLGLAIVRNLVTAHGGTVSAYSAGKGLGSELTVRLPAAIPKVDSAPVLAPAPTPTSAPGLSILVVDDNEDVARMSSLSLRRLGHSIRVAHDGPSALRAVQTFIPEVALVDIGLPAMDGYELARLLRKVPGLERIFLVAVTGYGQDSDRDRSLAAGFDLHLVKPVDRARYKAVLDQFTAERALRR